MHSNQQSVRLGVNCSTLSSSCILVGQGWNLQKVGSTTLGNLIVAWEYLRCFITYNREISLAFTILQEVVSMRRSYFNPIQARGSLGTPQRFLSITLRAFEIILWNLVTFPKNYWKIRWNFKLFKIRSHDHVIWE